MVAIKKHPSEAGFQIARIYARALHRRMGGDLKAVLETGSNAIGMSIPTSDVDLVVVTDAIKPGEAWTMEKVGSVFKAQNEVVQKLAVQLNVSIIPTAEFLKLEDRSYRPAWRNTKFASKQIRDAALPVFVQRDFENECREILQAQNYAQHTQELLGRYRLKGETAKRNEMRLAWKKKSRPLIGNANTGKKPHLNL